MRVRRDDVEHAAVIRDKKDAGIRRDIFLAEDRDFNTAYEQDDPEGPLHKAQLAIIGLFPVAVPHEEPLDPEIGEREDKEQGNKDDRDDRTQHDDLLKNVRRLDRFGTVGVVYRRNVEQTFKYIFVRASGEDAAADVPYEDPTEEDEE